MARDYIPFNDLAFVAWMNNFLTVLNANLAPFGLTAGDLTPLTNARNDFQISDEAEHLPKRRDCLPQCVGSQEDLTRYRREPLSADGAAHQPPSCDDQRPA